MPPVKASLRVRILSTAFRNVVQWFRTCGRRPQDGGSIPSFPIHKSICCAPTVPLYLKLCYNIDMTNCFYCKKQLRDDHTDNGSDHYVCDAIYDRRLKNNVCTKCGINKQVPEVDDTCCSKCCGTVGGFEGYGLI